MNWQRLQSEMQDTNEKIGVLKENSRVLKEMEDSLSKEMDCVQKRIEFYRRKRKEKEELRQKGSWRCLLKSLLKYFIIGSGFVALLSLAHYQQIINMGQFLSIAIFGGCVATALGNGKKIKDLVVSKIKLHTDLTLSCDEELAKKIKREELIYHAISKKKQEITNEREKITNALCKEKQILKKQGQKKYAFYWAITSSENQEESVKVYQKTMK